MKETVDLKGLIDAISSGVTGSIPAVRTVAAMENEPPADTMATPAVLLSIDEFTPARRVTGGRLAIKLALSAFCLLSRKTVRADLEVVNMAASVAALVDGQRWGLGGCVEPPQAVQALPGVFAKGGDGLACWVVTWEQVVHVGEVWVPPNGPDGEYLTGEGFYLRSCHDEVHRLEDFPK